MYNIMNKLVEILSMSRPLYCLYRLINRLIYRVHYRHMLNLRSTILLSMLSDSFFGANELYPKSTSVEKNEIAHLVLSGFLNYSYDIEINPQKRKCIDSVRDHILSDQMTVGNIAYYFCIESFYYSIGNQDGFFPFLKERENELLDQARLYVDSLKPISMKDIELKDIKQSHKMLRKRIDKLIADIKDIELDEVDAKISKIIKPVRIKTMYILLFVSVFSSLSLAGGVLYNKLILGFLGLRTSDFFDITDYVSSGIDLIFRPIIYAFIGLMIFFYGAHRILLRVMSARQFHRNVNQIVVSSEDREFKIIVFVLAALFVLFTVLSVFGMVLYGVEAFLEQFSLTNYAVLVAFVIDYIFIGVLKIQRYIKDGLLFRNSILFVALFFSYIFLDAADILYKVRNGSYKSAYIVVFKMEYNSYSSHDFLFSSSKYAFLLDQKTKEVTAIPKAGIKALRVRTGP